MQPEVDITEKLNELFASLFIREEDELLPKREMHFPETERQREKMKPQKN